MNYEDLLNFPGPFALEWHKNGRNSDIHLVVCGSEHEWETGNWANCLDVDSDTSVWTRSDVAELAEDDPELAQQYVDQLGDDEWMLIDRASGERIQEITEWTMLEAWIEAEESRRGESIRLVKDDPIAFILDKCKIMAARLTAGEIANFGEFRPSERWGNWQDLMGSDTTPLEAIMMAIVCEKLGFDGHSDELFDGIAAIVIDLGIKMQALQ